jgi:antitoxin ParD1/3/4
MYSSSSDYVRDLIRRDQDNRRQQRLLQAAITEGLKSGVSERSMEDVLKEAQARLTTINLISVLIGFAANRAEETQERRVVAEWNAALRRPILQWCLLSAD